MGRVPLADLDALPETIEMGGGCTMVSYDTTTFICLHIPNQ